MGFAQAMVNCSWLVLAVPGGPEICPGTYGCSLKIGIWDAPDVIDRI